MELFRYSGSRVTRAWLLNYSCFNHLSYNKPKREREREREREKEREREREREKEQGRLIIINVSIMNINYDTSNTKLLQSNQC